MKKQAIQTTGKCSMLWISVSHRIERVFIVSIRKDLDDGSFIFPEGFDLKTKLKDVLEKRVPEKFYLSDVMIDGFERHKDRMAERER